MIDEIISGPVLAMEIACSVNEFRAHVGPWDVDVAQKLHPTSIRAKFGKNTIQNAVHCTDLREEANNELSYFFDILSEE
jgi:nucleoside-diphosphate kinase